MRVLVTGPAGQVGWECQRSLQALGDIRCIARAECDLVQPGAIRAAVREVTPDVIVNTAAYTAVDRAESEPDLAHAVNAVAPAVLAEEAKRLGASLIHLSTDYVFDGTKTAPYVEDDACNPLSVYGRTKLQGEQAILASGAAAMILRTSWVYATRGHNFLRTIVRLAGEREELRIVDDQVGSPTCAADFAEALLSIVGRLRLGGEIPWGTYHYCGRGITSWFGFARHILQTLVARRQIDAYRVVPITTREYPTAAGRPAFSALDCSRIQANFGIRLTPWQTSVEQTIDRLLA